MSEGLAPGSEVTVYSATDADLNANLRYRFTDALITGEDENKLPVTDLSYLQVRGSFTYISHRGLLRLIHSYFESNL